MCLGLPLGLLKIQTPVLRDNLKVSKTPFGCPLVTLGSFDELFFFFFFSMVYGLEKNQLFKFGERAVILKGKARPCGIPARAYIKEIRTTPSAPNAF